MGSSVCWDGLGQESVPWKSTVPLFHSASRIVEVPLICKHLEDGRLREGTAGWWNRPPHAASRRAQE